MIRVHEFNEQGVANLLSEVIFSAREDFERAYNHYHDVLKMGRMSDYVVRQAADMYTQSKAFFYSDLFCSFSPIQGDDYIEYMIKEIKKNGTLRNHTLSDV